MTNTEYERWRTLLTTRIQDEGTSLYGPSVHGIQTRIQEIVTEQGFEIYQKEKACLSGPPTKGWAIRRFREEEITRATLYVSLMTDIRYKGVGKK